ncbi:MAG: hypothetical protein QM726_25455 [Chitinophagaceae bacterium]
MAIGVPTVSVPPILTCVLEGGVTDVTNEAPVLAAPRCRLMLPPLLPVSVISGPFKIEIAVPALASISKMVVKT